MSFVLRLFRHKTDIQIKHAYLADEKQGKAFEWRSWTSLMLSSSDGQRQDGCLLNIQDKQELTGLKGYFSGNLVESTWEDESTTDEYVTPGLISLFKGNISNNLRQKAVA